VFQISYEESKDLRKQRRRKRTVGGADDDDDIRFTSCACATRKILRDESLA